MGKIPPCVSPAFSHLIFLICSVGRGEIPTQVTWPGSYCTIESVVGGTLLSLLLCVVPSPQVPITSSSTAVTTLFAAIPRVPRGAQQVVRGQAHAEGDGALDEVQRKPLRGAARALSGDKLPPDVPVAQLTTAEGNAMYT